MAKKLKGAMNRTRKAAKVMDGKPSKLIASKEVASAKNLSKLPNDKITNNQLKNSVEYKNAKASKKRTMEKDVLPNKMTPISSDNQQPVGNWVYTAAKAGVGGGLVLGLANSRGRQSNAQLYGQGQR